MSNERKDVFNTPESGTYDPKLKRRGYRLAINSNTGEIVATGKRKPPPEWIPEGWVQLAANRWQPRWPACIYRRLNVKPWVGRPPEVQALCIKYDNYGEEIEHQTCMDCTVYKAPAGIDLALPRGVSIDDLFKRTWRQILDTDEDGSQEAYFHPLSPFEEDELDALEERAFQLEMKYVPTALNDPKNARNRRRVQMRWVPCIHRIEVEKSPGEIRDCGGCGTMTIICNHPEADAFGKKLRRKICKECPLAEGPPDE